MSKELQIIPSPHLETAADSSQTLITQVGDKNTQIAHANNVTNTINIIMPSISSSVGSPVLNTNITLNTEYYNLFVIGEESFDGNHFIIQKERAITTSEGISADIAEQFAGLGKGAIERIKTFPSLFMSENRQYGKTDPDQNAYFGLVSDVKIQDNGIKVYFRIISALPQQRLNELTFNLSLKRSTGLNELNRTHWAIIRIDLLEELNAAGINVFSTT